MPPANSEVTASRCSRSPSFSRRWISTRCGPSSVARAQAAQRLYDLLAGRRRARRRTPPPAPSAPRRRTGPAARRPARCGRRCRRAPSPARSRRPRRTARARVRPPARRWMMSWVMRSPSCSHAQVLGQRRVLGELAQQLAQQQRRALDVAPRLLDEPPGSRRRGGASRLIAREYGHPLIATGALHEFFTTRSRVRNPSVAVRCDACAPWRPLPDNTSTLYAGELEIRLGEGSCWPAGGR